MNIVVNYLVLEYIIIVLTLLYKFQYKRPHGLAATPGLLVIVCKKAVVVGSKETC